MATVAWLGLGVMGTSMAGHLLRVFGGLTVWNRSAARAEGLAQAGARVAATPAEAARGADIVCLCVSDTRAVQDVVFGPQGVAEDLAPGALVLDFSTISDGATEDFARRVAALGARWVDAPVSGGDVGARNGTLTIMAGGAAEDFARALPIFQAFGRKIEHMGPVGAGQRTKLANQIAVVGTLVSLAESLNYAREKGMDVARVLDVIGSGAAGSWSLSNYGPRLLAGNLAPGFSAKLMTKDLRLVRESLEGLGADYSTTRRITELFEAMVADGDGGLGNHAIATRLGWPRGGVDHG